MSTHNTDKTTVELPKFFCFTKKTVERIITLITITSAIVGILSWRDSKVSLPKVRLSVLNNQCLTKVASIPRLTSSFVFDGREVRNLWVSKIRLENECNRNIIGVHGHDLMSSNLFVFIAKEFRVIQTELEQSEFDVDVQSCNEGFSLSFTKWRPRQGCVLKVYCEGNGVFDSSQFPSFLSDSEPFTQGELIVADYNEAKQKTCLLKRMPYWLAVSCIFIGIIVFGSIGLIVVYCFVNNWVVMIKRIRWNRKYRERALSLISKLPSDSEASGGIDCMPLDFWRNNNIPKPPKRSFFLYKEKICWSEILTMNFMFIIVFLLACIATCALIHV